MSTKKNKQTIVIIGAGPAGLGCAYELMVTQKRTDIAVHIIDRNDIVGGLARTHDYKKFHFDVGPHRYYTTNKEVQRLWEDVLGADLRPVSRLTRISYNQRLFLYPVRLADALKKLGFVESMSSLASYLYARVRMRHMKAKTFEQWITKHFGKKLYTIFFKTYTEKVWGISCDEIGAEWAASRIKNLSLSEIIRTAVFGQKGRRAKSLVSTFYYPLHGAGQMYETMAARITKAGGKIHLSSTIIAIKHSKNNIGSVVYETQGVKHELTADYLFSSMPLTHFIQALDPRPAWPVRFAAKKLYYRDHITVNLIVKSDSLFADHWIYVHDSSVKMARIANYRNFSPQMVSGDGYSGISVEYFAFKGDAMWQMSDGELIALATRELGIVGLVQDGEVEDGFVIRETESYPMYYMGHREYFDTLKSYATKIQNLQLIGRGGMYKYNNMDHAIYTGILAARNYRDGTLTHDIWNLHDDEGYTQEVSGKPPEKNQSRWR